ncbi:MAG: D-alanyl-D-alanine carboxypeptidase family protein [Tuberibacillus sp.]
MFRKIGLALLCTFLLLFVATCEQKKAHPAPIGKNGHKWPEEAEQSPTRDNENNNAAAQTATGNPIKKDRALPDMTLQKGDRGSNVVTVQQALKNIGYAIAADGIFGDQTAQAILDLKSQIKGMDKNNIYDAQAEEAITSVLGGNVKITPGKTVITTPPKQDNNGGDDTPDQVVTNPTSTLVLVNKTHKLPDGYRPPDLVEPKVPFPFKEKLEKRLLRKEAATALEKLFAAAKANGLHLFAQSGFRSYERQKAIFASNAKKYGEKEANRVSAYPGESEHQTGLTMDVTSPSVNYDLIEPFGTTAEGRWLRTHAHEYGFIIRYPQGKETITGYSYEPWHIRYVGIKAATDIANRGMTLEEYLGEQ